MAAQHKPDGGSTGPQVIVQPASPSSAATGARPMQLVGGSGVRPAPPTAVDATTAAFSAFIDLEVEARACSDLAALRLAIVNSTRRLAPFDQAFLVERSGGGAWRVSAASSIAGVDRQTPLVRFIEAWANAPRRFETQKVGEPHVRGIAADATAWSLDVEHCTFASALWLPLPAKGDTPSIALVALKNQQWLPQHILLLSPLSGTYAHAWAALAPKQAAFLQGFRQKLKRWHLGLVALAAIALSCVIPVPLNALAPAEVVAAEAGVVAAPIDGIVAEIFVAPGSRVERGTPILKFVDTKLRNDVEVAARAKAVAEAKYFRVLQTALSSQKDLQEISIVKAELDVATAELVAARDLLDRSVIRADRSGLLLYSAKSDWIGKPVAIGERMMEIADPEKLELRIDLPVSDAMVLEPGGAVHLFLDGDPFHALDATIERLPYRPVATPDHQLVFRTFARFGRESPRQIGLHGTARLQGNSVSLAYYLLRRPIAAARQRIGL